MPRVYRRRPLGNPHNKVTQEAIVSILEGEEVNASGHRYQLQRQYGIWSICGLALTIDNAWIALGGSIITALGMITTTVLTLSCNSLSYS